MSSALSFVREKKTFEEEEEEEERKISLADSSVFFQHPTNEGKKKKEKKGRKKNATNTQQVQKSIALSGSRALFLFLFLSPDGTKSLRVSTIRPLYLFHLQSLK